jgi:histone H3/H4
MTDGNDPKSNTKVTPAQTPKTASVPEPKHVVKKSGRKSSAKSMSIPYACMKRMAQDSSGGMRVSSDTVIILEKATEQFVEKLISLAKSYTEHRGRKTLTARDVEVALKNYSTM